MYQWNGLPVLKKYQIFVYFLQKKNQNLLPAKLFQLMEGKTVIAIAHRLSTIAQLDRLVVIDAGSLIESGSHDELIQNSRIYADLWARQSGGFLAPEEYEEKTQAAWGIFSGSSS